MEISGTSKNDEFKRKDIEGLLFRLENISDSYFGEFLDPIGSSMSDIWNNGESIYISLPVLSSPKISRSLGKIILGDLAFAVSEKYKRENLNPGPIGVYIDELGAVITREFIELLNKCRGVGMELTFAFQSPSDIEDISENLCQQILENASNWFIFKQRMEKGANLFSKAIGTVEGRKSTIQVRAGEELDQGSQRAVEENLVHSNIIKNLSPGQCILLRHDPVQIDLVNVRFLDQKRIDHEIQFLKEIGEFKTPVSTTTTTTTTKAKTKEVSLV
jgi:type IV secretory pathway TraG/TraD family ATPase VirD4